MTDENKYRWKKGFRGSGVLKAHEAYKELMKIKSKHGGEILPEHVVSAAKSKRSKLHKFFEWDDSVAAQAHRKAQAMLITRSIVVERPEIGNAETRVFELSRSKLEPRTQSYTTMEEIMEDPEARAELLQRALGELLALRRRHAALQELAIVFRAIDEVLVNVRV